VEPLVPAAWLAEHLDDPDLRVLECTVHLRRDPDGIGYRAVGGRDDWATAHVPGSAYADLVDDLSDPTSPLRFTLPSAERFAAAMERLAVGDGTRVVCYDRRFSMWATRVWWMLRAFGFDDAAVLDGGWTAWTAGGHPVSTDPPLERAATFTPRPRPGLFVTKAQVTDALDGRSTCLVNALSAAQHRGEDLTYGRPGHLPGARNVYAVDLLDPSTHCFLPLDQLRARFDDAGVAGERIITYCGGGIAATSDAFALHLLGHDDIAVYDGSLSEWTADPDAPMVVD
jgi:thiosulfate/3-mercaptopyruvate sulfurtransferase